MTRIEELTLKLADGPLSDAEDDELGKLIRENPDALRLHLSLLELEAELRARNPAPSRSEEILERVQKQVFAGIEQKVMDRIQEQKSPAGVPTARSTRRGRRTENPSWRIPALVAAGILAVLTLFWALGPSEPDPAAPEQAKKAKARLARDLEQKRQAAEADMKRREAEAHLQQIEERRRALTQARPEPAESPEAKDKRAKDLLELKKDQERIEQELREAVLAAQKAVRPVEAAPRVSEKPSVASSAGATRAIVAKVEEVSGEAFLVAKEGKSPLTSGMNLLSAQGLETGGGASRLVLSFPDATRVDFGPDSVLSELSLEKGKRLFVQKGSVRALVSKQFKGEPLIFATPHGEARVLGTMLRLQVDADPKKGTRLEVEEGKVELRNPADKTLLVESGQYAVSAAGAALIARPLEPPRTIDDLEGPLSWRQSPDCSVVGISLVRDRVHGGRAAVRIAYRPQAGDPATWGTMNRPLRLRPEDRALRFYVLVEDHAAGSNWTLQFRQRDTTCWLIGSGDCIDLRPGWNRIDLDLPRDPKLMSDPVGPFDPTMVESLLFSICQKPAVLLLDDFAVISAPRR